MTITWCEAHKCQTNPYDDDNTQCLAATHVIGVNGVCRMVPMRLIPDNALVATVTWGGEPHWIIPASALAGEDTDGN